MVRAGFDLLFSIANSLSAKAFSLPGRQSCFPMRVMGTVTSRGVGTSIRSISV